MITQIQGVKELAMMMNVRHHVPFKPAGMSAILIMIWDHSTLLLNSERMPLQLRTHGSHVKLHHRILLI